MSIELPVSDARAALRKRVENDFGYHLPKPGQTDRCASIRDNAKHFALMLVNACPVSRELSVALTKLEEVVFAANSAIVRNE